VPELPTLARAARRGLAAALVALLLAPRPAEARGRAPAARLRLDGATVAVRWVDGDTFRLLGEPGPPQTARLLDVNALESYGPVHRWGGWTPAELLVLAREATAELRAGEWECSAPGGRDGYGRLLVSCPGAAEHLVRRGLAMAFAVGGPAPARLLRLQRQAQERGAGMWAKGIPGVIVSSLHSPEEQGGGEAYDRVVDTATGEARKAPHRSRYRTCQEVCRGDPEGGSCMVYVPFERRYRDRPGCLRGR
jgi:endonuclease YncB( thermonuclease family)